MSRCYLGLGPGPCGGEAGVGLGARNGDDNLMEDFLNCNAVHRIGQAPAYLNTR